MGTTDVAPVERVAVCPGTFDPITRGHEDIIRRAARLFDRVVVGVVDGPRHKTPLLGVEERVALVRSVLGDLDAVDVEPFDGLVVDLAQRVGACALVKGVRGAADIDAERTMADLNDDMAPDLETVVLLARPQWRSVSSSGVRELVSYGRDVSRYVRPDVEAALTRS